MTEQVNNIVDTTKPVVEAQVEPALQAQNTAGEPESVQDVNWRNFRANRDKERKEREESDKRAREKEKEAEALKAALDALVNKQQPQNQNHEQAEETEEDRIQKHVEKALHKRDQEESQKRVERERQEMPSKLATVYSDFNKVCTEDNIDYLEYHYPEVADAYKHMPDGFDKWSNVYKAIKRFVPNTDTKKDQAKADKNFTKPQAISKPGATPTGDSAPVYLDDKRRNDNWKRMQRVMKGV